MKGKKWARVFCAALAALTVLSGCGGGSASGGASQGGDAAPSKEVTIALTGDVNTWNPWKYNELVANSVQRHVYDTLIEVDNDMKMQPALATEWSTEDGGKTWIFKLREGVTFSNGNPFTADDVVFSFETCIKNGKGWSSACSTIDTIEAVDDLTVKFTAKEIDAILPSSVKDVMILDKETYGEMDEATLDGTTTVVCTGRYVLEEYVRDDHTTLKANPNYWGEKPAAEKVTFRSIPNDGTRIASLVAQEVDMIGNVPVNNVDMLESKDYLTLMSEPSIGVMMYSLSQTEEDPSPDAQMPIKSPDGSNPLASKDVRLAIAHAIDYQQLIDKVQNGYAVMAPTLVPEGFNGYNPNIEQYTYDTALSEQLLDQAGYPRQADGYRFEITLDCTNDRYINDAAAATAIAGYLDKVGIKCNVNAMSRSVFFQYIKTWDEEDKSHFIQSGWSDTSGESVVYARDLLYSADLSGQIKEGFGVANRGYYQNPEVDALIDQALATADYDERDAIMQQVWQIVHDDAALLTTYFTSDVYAVNNRVTYTPRKDQYIFAWNFAFGA